MSDTGWDTLVQNYYRAIYAFAHQFLGSVSEAEDATQEIFIRAYERRNQLRDKRAEKSWLYSIARSYCIDRTRWWKRLIDRTGVAEDLSSSTDHDLRLDLARGIRSLPIRQREVFILRQLHEFSTAETAAQLRISTGSVKTHLSRAIARLKLALDLSTNELAQSSLSSEAHEH